MNTANSLRNLLISTFAAFASISSAAPGLSQSTANPGVVEEENLTQKSTAA
jgi:hypothetical protein